MPPWRSTIFRTSLLSSTWVHSLFHFVFPNGPGGGGFRCSFQFDRQLKYNYTLISTQTKWIMSELSLECRCGVPPLFEPGDAGVPLRSDADSAELWHGAAEAPRHRVQTGPEPRQRHPPAGAQQHLLHAPPLLLSAPRWRPGPYFVSAHPADEQAGCIIFCLLFLFVRLPRLLPSVRWDLN